MEPWQTLADQVETAVRHVFGDSDVGDAVVREVALYRKDCEQIATNRGMNATTIAVIGAKKQGKTWIARQLVKTEPVREKMPSGDLTTDGTKKLHWVGPIPPESLDDSIENYWHCSSEELAELGFPYMLLDTPAVTDIDDEAARISRTALPFAQVKLLVSKRSRVRDGCHAAAASFADGSIIVPVITEVADGDGDLAVDAETLRNDVREAAPRATVLPAVFVRKFNGDADERDIAATAVQSIRDALRSSSRSLTSPEAVVHEQLEARKIRFLRRTRHLLSSAMPELKAAVEDLEEATDRLPREVVASMLGSDSVLRASLRARLRADVMEKTSPLWFPCRTVLGLLNLTHGAWDRLLLTFAGSAPSFFTTLLSAARNVRESRSLSEGRQEALRQQIAVTVRDRLRPLASSFQRRLGRISAATLDEATAEGTTDIELRGIVELQSESAAILERTIATRSTPRRYAELNGLVGVLLFWGLMAGPVLSLYRQYFQAAKQAIVSKSFAWSDFPTPSASMLMTSVMLSLLPLALLCMAFLATALRRSKIDACAKEVRQKHMDKIEQLTSERILRLELGHGRLDDARYIMSL